MPRSKYEEGREEPIEIDVTIIHETEKAFKCDVGGDEPVWLPKSELVRGADIDRDSGIGDSGIALIPGWLAEEKGLY